MLIEAILEFAAAQMSFAIICKSKSFIKNYS
jgi:hypothetical protein